MADHLNRLQEAREAVRTAEEGGDGYAITTARARLLRLEEIFGRGGQTIDFNAKLHPRDREGRFRNALNALDVGQHLEVKVAGTKLRVTKHADKTEPGGANFSVAGKGAAEDYLNPAQAYALIDSVNPSSITPRAASPSTGAVDASKVKKGDTVAYAIPTNVRYTTGEHAVNHGHGKVTGVSAKGVEVSVKNKFGSGYVSRTVPWSQVTEHTKKKRLGGLLG